MSLIDDGQDQGQDELIDTVTEWMRICIRADAMFDALPAETQRKIVAEGRTVEALVKDVATLTPMERCRIEGALMGLARLLAPEPVSQRCERPRSRVVRRFRSG